MLLTPAPLNSPAMVERRKIFGLAGANLVIAGLGVISTMQIAWIFGAGRTSDIWFAASALQNSMISLVQTGQLSEMFLPEYIKIKSTHGRTRATECFSAAINWMMAFAIVVVVLAWAAAPYLVGYIASGFADSDQSRLAEIFLWLLPLLPLHVLTGLIQSFGNAEGWFGKFEIPVIAGSLSAIFTVMVLSPSQGVHALVISAWVYQMVSIAGRMLMLHKLGYVHRWTLQVSGLSLRPLLTQIVWTFAYVGVTQAYLMSFRRALGFLGEGTLSAYGYAELLYARTSSLFMRPVATVFYTKVAEAGARSMDEVKKTVKGALDRYLEMYILILASLVPGLGDLLRALWGGPRFGEDMLRLTTLALLWFFLAQVMQAQSQVQRKLNIALGCFRQQYQGATLVQLICLFAAPWLVSTWQFNGAIAAVLLNTVGFALAGLLLTWMKFPGLLATFSIKKFSKGALMIAPGLFLGWLMSGLFASRVHSVDSVIIKKLCALGNAGVAAGISLATLLLMRHILRQKSSAAGTR